MKRSASLCVLLLLLFAGTRAGLTQVVESASEPGLHVRVGAMASGFQPGEGPNYLIGPGTYVDIHFTHWIQLEGEARWLHFNDYAGETQANYLIGPRVPVFRFRHRTEIYAKALIGEGTMTFPFSPGSWGHFTALAFGGSADIRMSHRLTLRAVDFEYQDWPVWLPKQSLQPYGISTGISYRVF